MVGFVSERLATVPLVMLLVSLLVFSFIHLAPGGPVDLMLGPEATPELEAALIHEYGLDRPLPEQYLSWLLGVLQGDLHKSMRTHEPVSSMILARLPASFTLAVLASVFSLLVSVPLGILAAVKRNSLLDYASAVAAMLGMATPNFVAALALILLLGLWLGMLPIAGAPSITGDPLRALPYYVMPTVALGLNFAALQMRLVRASLLEVLGKDYIRTAYGKGLRSRSVLWSHALRNALIPLVTIVALNFAQILSGTVVIEQIFGIPGVGSLFLQSILQRDFPVAQGISLAIALFFILANLAADFLYGWIDPRIRVSG